jgi:pimeloyl-ACP methyl ester carboxylesterase
MLSSLQLIFREIMPKCLGCTNELSKRKFVHWERFCASAALAIILVCRHALAQNAPDENAGLRSVPQRHRIIERTVTVPERYGSSQPGKTIELYVMVIQSPNAVSHVPVFWLSGGPGAAVSDEFLTNGTQWIQKVAQRLSETRDVVLVDQRGTGRTQPRLSCSERISVPLDHPASRDTYILALTNAILSCRNRWESRQIDLSAYNTIENAHDIESVRIALGYDKIAFVGESYGTHLALAYLKYFPGRAERAVLMGVQGLADTMKMPAWFDEAMAHLDSWHKTLPMCPYCDLDLRREIELVRARLSAGNVLGSYIDETGAVVIVALSAFDLDLSFFNEARNSNFVFSLPSLVSQMKANDFSWLARRTARTRRDTIGSAMYYSMICASGVSRERLQLIEESARNHPSGTAANFPFPYICNSLGVSDLGDEFRAPFDSDVPVLFVGGALDVRTPISAMREVASRFANATFYEEDNLGHESPRNPLFIEKMVQFFQ